MKGRSFGVWRAQSRIDRRSHVTVRRFHGRAGLPLSLRFQLDDNIYSSSSGTSYSTGQLNCVKSLPEVASRILPSLSRMVVSKTPPNQDVGGVCEVASKR